MQSNSQYIMKPSTPGEIADLYDVTTKTLKTWTDKHRQKIGEKAGKYFSTLQVKTIFECLGPPTKIFSD